MNAKVIFHFEDFQQKYVELIIDAIRNAGASHIVNHRDQEQTVTAIFHAPFSEINSIKVASTCGLYVQLNPPEKKSLLG